MAQATLALRLLFNCKPLAAEAALVDNHLLLTIPVVAAVELAEQVQRALMTLMLLAGIPSPKPAQAMLPEEAGAVV